MTTRDYLKVVGIDPSLTSTGIAIANPEACIVADTLRSRHTGPERLHDLRNQIREHVHLHTLVVIEGPAHGSAVSMRQQGHHERAGLWWAITLMLWRLDIPYAICPPSTRAKWATGKGNANKDAVLLATERRFPAAEVTNNNEADATVLAAIGAHALGWLGEQPKYSSDALLKVQWPNDDITRALLQPYEQLTPVEEASA